MDDKTKNEIADILSKKDFIVFAGAGVSQSIKIPNWEDLLEKLAKAVNYPDQKRIENASSREYPIIAQEIYDDLKEKGEKNKYYEIIKNEINSPIVDHGTEHLDIVFTSKCVITTNFDNCFELAYSKVYEIQSLRKKPNVYSLPDFNKNLIVSDSVYYIHGKANENYIVFKEDDYKKYYPTIYNNQNGLYDIESFLEQVYQAYPLVFLGFSFEENIKEIFKKKFSDIKRSDEAASEKLTFEPKLDKIKHFCFLKREISDDISKEKQKQKYDKFLELKKELENINIKVFEMDKFRDWTDVFQLIREKRKTRSIDMNIEE